MAICEIRDLEIQVLILVFNLVDLFFYFYSTISVKNN